MNPTNWHGKYCVDSGLKYPSEKTQKNYQSTVLGFLWRFKDEETPSHIKTDAIKEWLLTFETINTRNHKLCAIKSFYEITVGMPLKLEKIPFSKRDNKVPKIIEEDEIQAMITACDNLKHKTILCLLYACGLRIGEVINLKIEDIGIDTIDIILAKGRKDRIVPLPENLRDLINKYISVYSPKIYLFNGWKNEFKYTEGSVRHFLKDIAVKAGVKTHVNPHKFRHSFATHSLEQGTSIVYLQEILGHSSPKTTSIYLHTSRKAIAKIHSPLNSMQL